MTTRLPQSTKDLSVLSPLARGRLSGRDCPDKAPQKRQESSGSGSALFFFSRGFLDERKYRISFTNKIGNIRMPSKTLKALVDLEELQLQPPEGFMYGKPMQSVTWTVPSSLSNARICGEL